jgi:hypothetical protein
MQFAVLEKTVIAKALNAETRRKDLREQRRAKIHGCYHQG